MAERLEQAVTATSRAEDELEDSRSTLTVAIVAWREQLTSVTVSDDELDRVLDAARDGHAAGPPLAAAVDRARGELADRQASVRTAQTGVSEEIAATQAEIEALRSARDDGPPPPAWERSARVERPGAPLWRLVDFRDGLGEVEQAGLEAALEASGLLDAWVTPSGAMEDEALADVIATSAEPLGSPSLFDALAPVADAPVGPAVVERLLRTIALGEASGTWLAVDGRFALGPLAGRGAKERAEHVGATAREARRARRLQALGQRLDALAARRHELQAELAVLESQRAALERELAALPDPAPVAAALQALEVTVTLEAQAARDHERACAATREFAGQELAADAARREHAAAHGLAPGLNEMALERLREATTELRGAAATAARSWATAERLTGQVHVRKARARELHGKAVEQDCKARDEAAEAERLRAEHEAREQALGATGEEVRRRHSEVQVELKAARTAERRAADAETEARVAAARLEGDTAAATRVHEDARARREAASIGFRQLGRAGILQLVLGDGTPPDVDQAGSGPSPVRSRSPGRFRRSCSPCAAPQASSGSRCSDGSSCSTASWRRPTWARTPVRGEDELLLVHVTEAGSEQTLAADPGDAGGGDRRPRADPDRRGAPRVQRRAGRGDRRPPASIGSTR